MRKGLLAALAIVLGLVIAAPVFSADLSVTGYMGIGYRLYKNLWPEINTAPDQNVDNWMQRVDLHLHLKTSDALTGKVRFYIDSFPNPWGTAMTGRNAMGTWGAEQVTVEVKEAYMDFKIPGLNAPTFVRAGVQYFDIRPFVFLTVPGAGISLRSTCEVAQGKFTVGAGWGKMRERDEVASDGEVGADLFYGVFDYKGKGYGLGAYIAATAGSRKDATGFEKGNIWWLGLYSDGKVGPVNYQADLIFDTGSEKMYNAPKYKYSGWLARAVLTYPYEKANFGLGALYVSGDDANKPNKIKGFVLPKGAETLGPASDSLIVVSGWGAGPGPMCDVGLTTNPFNFAPKGSGYLAQEGWGGIWGVRLFADYKALDWLKLAAQVAYWGDTYKNGDTFERALGTKDKDEKSIGVEVDLGAQVSIYKNLNLYTAFGYLFKGKAVDMKESGKEIDNPYAFVVNLIYTF